MTSRYTAQETCEGLLTKWGLAKYIDDFRANDSLGDVIDWLDYENVSDVIEDIPAMPKAKARRFLRKVQGEVARAAPANEADEPGEAHDEGETKSGDELKSNAKTDFQTTSASPSRPRSPTDEKPSEYQFPQCEFKKADGKWVKCDLSWSWLDRKIAVAVVSGNKKTKTKTKTETVYDSVFVKSDSLYIEGEDILYEFRKIDLKPMIQEIIYKGLLPKCTWAIPLMHNIAENDEATYAVFEDWITKQVELEAGEGAASSNNIWDEMSNLVQNKLSATQTLSYSIKAIAKRHKKITNLVSKEDELLLTPDAKEYVQEIKNASSELWDLCLKIRSFANDLRMESKLNQIRIKQWLTLNPGNANGAGVDFSPESVLYRKVKHGIQRIIDFGAGKEMCDLAEDIREQIAKVKQKFVVLDSQEQQDRFKLRQKKFNLFTWYKEAKTEVRIFLAGATVGATMAGIALGIVLSATLSFPIGWVFVGLGIVAVAAGAAFYRYRAKRDENKGNHSQQKKALGTLLKDSQKDCDNLERAMAALRDLFKNRSKLSDGLRFDIRDVDILKELQSHFAECVVMCDELKKIVDGALDDVLAMK